MREIKFTSDGKKVVVIGSLNSLEKIVQEIFVIDGSEVPSGEHFVVKSLHDAPAESWKEKNLRELDARYERERTKYETETRKYEVKYREEYALFREKISYLRSVIKNVSVEAFDVLVAFLTGEIKYIVKYGYSPEIIEYKDFRCDYDHEKLKLITLFGNDDGTLTWGINRYSDGSGSNEAFYPFSNKEDAVEKLTQLLLAKENISIQDINQAKKYDIKLSPEKIEKWRTAKVGAHQKDIDGLKKRIGELETEISNTESI